MFFRKQIICAILVLVVTCLSLWLYSNFFSKCNNVHYTDFGFVEAPFELVKTENDTVAASWTYKTSSVPKLVSWLFSNKIYQKDFGEIDYENGLADLIERKPSGFLCNQHISSENEAHVANVKYYKNEKKEIFIVITIFCF